MEKDCEDFIITECEFIGLPPPGFRSWSAWVKACVEGKKVSGVRIGAIFSSKKG